MASYLPLFATALPLITAPIIYFMDKFSKRVRNLTVIGITLLTLLLVVLMFPVIEMGNLIKVKINFLLPLGLVFRVDELGLFLALITSFVWFLISIYSSYYMSNDKYLNRYYIAFLLTLSGCLGVALTGGLLSLYFFFEIASLIPYILIIHNESKEAVKASAKYLYMCLFGSLALFFAISLTFYLLGTVDLNEIKQLSREGKVLPLSVFLGFFIGFGIKGGLFPLHVWLPDAHPVAPSPISSLLSGITVKVGMYGIIRLVYSMYGFEIFNGLGWGLFLRIIAVITILLGSSVAVKETNLKRMLAYSSISNMGYILLGIALLTERALIGAVFHIFSHAFMKGSLFLCAGAIKHKTGKTMIKQMNGIGYEMPITMFCFTIAALGMIGIPPLNGFISKWYLGLGSLDAQKPIYLIVLIISSLLNGVYFLPIIINAFFNETYKTNYRFRLNEISLSMLIPIIILTSGIVLGGMYEHTLLKLAKNAVKMLLG
ncbi:MAG: multicomponent Na+:H+ antiporter subunit [Thermosediminibacterales bacterium]|nr:multicomponent Na+:H+ antiporter subunit [Thermosediminibacterales bacterium]